MSKIDHKDNTQSRQNSLLDFLFGKSGSSASNKAKRRRSRTCRIEELESREMLSVSFAEFETLRNQCADLNLTDYDDYNIIEIGSNDHDLRTAIGVAGTTEKDDIIVIRTTADTPNTLTLTQGEVRINVNAASSGKVIIVSLDTNPLAIDAGQASRVFNITAGTTVVMAGLVIAGGNVNENGGGILNNGTLTVTSCNITGNSAANGGGIYNDGSIIVTYSTIAENSATISGGGIYGNGSVTVINSIVTGNSSDSDGGGIYSNGSVAITNSTIAGNAAGDGGGIHYHGGTLTINNTIVAKNENDNDFYVESPNYMPGISGRNNLIGNGTGQYNFSDKLNGNIVGTAEKPIDPFVNGYYYLADDSVAIDAGNNDLAKDATGNPIFYDLDGKPRISGGIVDIGAYETGTAERLSAPENVTAIVKDYSTITIGWTAVDGASSGYTIQYATDENFTQNVKRQTVDTGTTADITDLTSGTTYYFRVSANATEDYSSSSPSEYATGTPVAQPLDPPTITVDIAGATSLTVQWNKIDDASSYRVEYSTDETFESNVRTQTVNQPSSGDTVSTNITGLTTEQTYYIRVIAIGTGNYADSPYSDAVSETPAATELDIPKNVTVTSRNATSLTVQWERVNNASNYRVEYSTDANFASDITQTLTVNQSSLGSMVSTNITGLTTRTLYHIRVKAIGNNDYSDSDYSEMKTGMAMHKLTVTTDPKTPGPHSLLIAWEATLLAGDVIQYKQSTTNEWIVLKGTSTGTSITLPGLEAGSYDVRLVDTQGNEIDLKTGTSVTSSDEYILSPRKPKASVEKVPPNDYVSWTVSTATIASVTLVIIPPATATSQSNVRYVIDCIQAGKSKDRPAGFTASTVTAESLAQSENKVLIGGLSPNTSYKFSITAVNANGNTMDGKAKQKEVVVNVKGKTAKYTAVRKLWTPKDRITSSTVTLKYEPSRAPLPDGVTAVRYEVLLYEGKSKIPTTLLYPMEAETGSAGASITGLAPKTKYKFAVQEIITMPDGLEIRSVYAKVSVKTKSW